MGEGEEAAILGGVALAGAGAVKVAGCMHPDALRAALKDADTAAGRDETGKKLVEAARAEVDRATDGQ